MKVGTHANGPILWSQSHLADQGRSDGFLSCNNMTPFIASQSLLTDQGHSDGSNMTSLWAGCWESQSLLTDQGYSGGFLRRPRRPARHLAAIPPD